MFKELIRKDVDDLHTELGHLSEVITQATEIAISLQLIGIFKSCKAYVLGKAEKDGVSKMAVLHSIVKGRRLFTDISSPSTVNIGGKKHWLFRVKNITDDAWI